MLHEIPGDEGKMRRKRKCFVKRTAEAEGDTRRTELLRHAHTLTKPASCIGMGSESSSRKTARDTQRKPASSRDKELQSE